MSNLDSNQQPFSGLKQQPFLGLNQHEFKSFDEVKKFIRDYEAANYMQTMVAHSRTIEGARNRGYKAYVSSDLKYTEILFRCIHGGSRKSRSKGARPNQSTYRQQCPFFIRLKANGDKLVVADHNEEHNHQCNKETNAFLPHQRILDDASKEYAKKMLSLRPNKKLLQVELLKTTNKNVTLRDLHNLGRESNADESLSAAVKYLTSKEDCVVELVKNEKNILLEIFFQDKEMQRLIHSYPEILFVDAIHKVCDRRMPLYILLIEDGNGESEIVGFYLVTNEELETMEQLPYFIKTHNPAWENITSVMTDKDFVEREVFKDAFPQAKLLICLFHCLRTFRREITSKKMGITSGERERCLNILQKLAYSRNEEEYNSYKTELEEVNIRPVTEYFLNNWHDIRHEWVVGLQQLNAVTYGNRTNNRMEAINSKVVQVVKRNSNLPELFQDLDKLIISLRLERNYRAAKVQLKVPITQSDIDDTQRQYMQYLTPYAYGLVAEQYSCMEKVQVFVDGNSFTAQSREGLLKVDLNSCSCSFFKSMQLPCRHVLKVRKVNELDAFSEDLCAIRWSKKYYVKNKRVVAHECEEEVRPTNTQSKVGIKKVKSRRVLSQFEKFSLTAKKTTKLASLASEAPARLFQQRLNVINFIVDMWEKGNEVSVTEVQHLENEVVETCTPSNSLMTETSVQEDEVEEQSLLELPNTINTAELVIHNSMEEVEENASKSVIEAVQPIVTPATIPQGVASTSASDDFPILPPKIKKRGRPKGAEMTVIGLPKKKRRSERVVVFERKHPKLKDLIMLKWFVSEESAKRAVSGIILDEDSVEQNPNLVSSASLDEKVCVSSLRKYFTGDAWLSIQHVVAIKRRSTVWLCPCCKTDSQENSISCDSCLEWYHLKCTTLKSFPKNRQWFCISCKRTSSDSEL